MKETVEEKDKIKEIQEEKQEEEIMNNPYQFKIKKTTDKKHKIKIVAMIIMTIFLITGILSTSFALINFNNVTILKGISIRDIEVEGLTEEEAINIINEKIEYEKTCEILIKINEETYSITPEQIEVQYNIEGAVETAYEIGRQGNIIQNNFAILNTMFKKNNIELEITYNEDLLNSILEDINAKLPDAVTDNTYCIEEDELIITKGKAGNVINVENAKKLIIEAIKIGSSEPIELETENEECPEIDIEKIYEEVKAEPQDATYTTDPFEIIPHENGIDFDIEEAKKILEEEKEEYVISLDIIEPEILTNEIGEEAFPDLLSSFSTKYDETNVSRSTNLKLAMSKLDGVVIMPGEVFSYNKTVGKRTVEEGYQYANGYSGGKVVSMLGGGICQISSTLYNAVLYANLEIVERYNHMFQAGYVSAGRDATVVYGSLDFQFENTRSYPIMLKTKCSGGLAEVKILGLKEEVEYEVEIETTILSYTSYSVVYKDDSSLAEGKEKVTQYGLQGCKSITYRIVKLNGQEISKEVLSTDTYSPLSKIISRGTASTSSTTETTKTETSTESEQTTEDTNSTETTTEQEQTTENTTSTETEQVTENTTSGETE